MPLTTTGKVIRRQLRERVLKEIAGDPGNSCLRRHADPTLPLREGRKRGSVFGEG